MFIIYLDTDPKSTISFDLIPDAWFLSISFKSCHANSICQHYQRHSYIILILILYFLSILSSESYILNVTLISQYINIHPLNFRWLYVKDGLCGMFFPFSKWCVLTVFFKMLMWCLSISCILSLTVARRVPLVAQELLTSLEYLSLHTFT